jgi:hypothetical protein
MLPFIVDFDGWQPNHKSSNLLKNERNLIRGTPYLALLQAERSSKTEAKQAAGYAVYEVAI